MRLSLLDWSVIAAYFLFNLGIGLYYARRARGSTSEFFLSGRNVPWWLAGTSMVATTFAADTPLAVTGFVAKNGIAGNWLWWNFVMSGMLTVFLYARLWRRAGVMTDIEFAELRYSGKPAAFLRGFRALYLGLPINCIILGWVNLAMVKILEITLGVSKTGAITIVIGMLLFTAFYTAISGLWGVLVTDLFQFALKMAMVIILAILAVNAVGGIDSLKTKIAAMDAGSGSRLAFFPEFDSVWMPAITLFVYLGVIWWSTWYPGAEPGGGGYVAQRIFSAKNEKHGLLATLWFNIAHYALRPWPWILTALASLILYPTLVDKESGYIKTLIDPNVFPTYLRGFMLAAFAAAYMSTIGTQLNWGASYVINDFYRRFVKRSAGEKHYVIASQIVTVLLMIASLIVTFNMESIGGAWKLLLVTGAGTGTVLLLRWFWWRINAWSEVSAMITAAAVSIFLQKVLRWDSDRPRDFAYIMLVTVGITTVVWIAVTMFTRAEPVEKLVAFYRRVQPEGPGWNVIAAEAGLSASHAQGSLSLQFVNWILGCALIYGSLFGIGKLIFKEWATAAIFLAVAIAAGVLISRNLSRGEMAVEPLRLEHAEESV
ncbi:MAG TPA: sodium:solute symporter family protein [Pyrinomonadaceae bacterium]|jgi:solute:Na+ symporter, SSS family|nr:sodium:solute symporter family protein [Pyrinomonadaceae bacterium]